MTDETNDSCSASLPNTRHGAALQEIERALATLQFGQIVVVVQDGVVVQIDRTERHRLRRGDRS